MAKAASRGKIANKINSKKNKGKTSQSTLQKAQKQKIGAKNVAPLNRGALQKKTKASGDEVYIQMNEFLQWKCLFDYDRVEFVWCKVLNFFQLWYLWTVMLNLNLLRVATI